jgi:hypothetical protein
MLAPDRDRVGDRLKWLATPVERRPPEINLWAPTVERPHTNGAAERDGAEVDGRA